MKDRILLVALVLSLPLGAAWFIYRSATWRKPVAQTLRLEDYGAGAVHPTIHVTT